MADPDHLRDLMKRGDDAKRLLAEPLYMEAFNKQSVAYLASLKMCRPDDDIGRWKYTVALNVIDMVKIHLVEAVRDSDNAEKQAEAMRKKSLSERLIRNF